MKHIELQSKGYHGLINHSIIQDGDLIVSFEDNEYKLYDKSYLNGRKILKVTNIPKLDLNCYEGLEILYKSQGTKMTTGRLGRYATYGLALFILLFIFFSIGVWYGAQLPVHKQEIVLRYAEEGFLKYIID